MEDSDDHPVEKEAEIYKRIQLLGSGSYGRAFLVRQIKDDSQWVIKQINLIDLSHQEQENALKQAKILELLNHQNIVKFKEVYRTAKMKLNIVMQYAACGDLSQRIKTAKETMCYFSEEQILKWFIQICLGVKHIHDRKIIHRDLKAQNIFLTGDNLVKIGDFGVARVLESTAGKAKTMVGSPYYLSPQIIQNKPYSFKTDIWSLGTLLFQLCSLNPPFAANNLQFLALKIVQGSYSQIPKQYSEGMRNLIKWMLQTKEANRPTINQVIFSKIVATRISNFVNQSQHIEQKPVINFIGSHLKMNTLKPPPNLIDLEVMENQSQLLYNNNVKQDLPSPNKTKAKTPQLNTRKGANNFFNRPASGRRKVVEVNDLADLIQIKPSHMQMHEKYEKPLPHIPALPKIPKPSSMNINFKNDLGKEKLKIVSPPSSAFSKNRTSFMVVDGIGKKKQGQVKIEKGQVKMQQKIIKKISVTKGNEKIQQKVNKKSHSKGLLLKKISGPIKTKKSPSQQKLQICSEEIKKRIITEKKMQKKIERPKKQKQKRPPKEQHNQIKPIMEEQKCNTDQQMSSNPSLSYYDQDFDSYSSLDDDEQVDLSLSDTLSGRDKNKNDFKKMLVQFENINEMVQNADGSLSNLPMLGESIPEIINFSADIREDDSDLQENHSSVQKFSNKVNTHLQSEDNLGFICFQDNAQLESIRMNLQKIFGEENIIFAYHKIQQKMNELGLDFDEEAAIKQIILSSNIDEVSLRKYIRLIVTILSIQKQIN